MSPARAWPALLLLALALGTAPADAKTRRWSRGLMGTAVQIIIWSPDRAPDAATNPPPGAAQPSTTLDAQVEAAFAEIARIDALMSGWKATSEVGTINAQAADHPVVVSPETYDLLKRAVAMGRESGGAFDITWAALRGIWDFKAIHPALPQPKQRLSAAALVDYRQLALNDARHSVRFRRRGMQVGLGGIAKGYAVDRAVALLEAAGQRHFVVSAGGDVCVRGTRGGAAWRVGIRHPRKGPDVLLGRLEAHDECVLTSGDYERFVWINGRRYHHILNPKTGMPANQTISATVVAKHATDADGYSTAAFVIGGAKGAAFLERIPHVEGLIVDAKGVLFVTPGLRHRIQLSASNITP